MQVPGKGNILVFMTTYLHCAVGVFALCVLLESGWKLLSTFQEKLNDK